MRTVIRFGHALLLVALPLAVALGAAGVSEFTVDAQASRVSIEVGKGGVFSFAAHAHEVEAPSVKGTVQLDPTDWPHSAVSLEFSTAALRVSAAGEPPADVPEVQRVMLSDKVLDVARFPVVSFRSTRVTVSGVTPQGADVRVEGMVTLHGTTHPLTVPVRATLAADGTLTARGSFSLKQTDFGMVPVTAAGGSIRVKDDVGVQFAIVARR